MVHTGEVDSKHVQIAEQNEPLNSIYNSGMITVQPSP
jgi:hypothetical protein